MAAAEPTFGFTIRGRMHHEQQVARLNVSGELLGQVNLDAVLTDESQLLVNADLGLRYRLSRAILLQGNLSHFQKSFYDRAGSYAWTDYDAFIRFSPTARYTGWFGYRYRKKTLEALERFRFGEDNLELRGRYNLTSKIFLEGVVTGSRIIHTDFNAVGVVDDTALIRLEYPQRDRGVEGLIHLRYWGKAIIGVQVGFGNIYSNSAIGAYTSLSFQVYASGRLRSSTFYHVVFRLLEKDYAFPKLGGESRYRDPEEQVQNLAHIRLEQVLGGGSIGYLQISLLENETIFNQRYYDKAMVEVGIKYEL
ncbi:MAG: hypothetical protein IIA60_09470 [Candidatus Marinimicrobia bacterium]|nr:hypothetical protein [Candidatus Neomarinimicrobiota bacterium]